MDLIEIIGFVAGALVSISFFPQIIKSWKTKSTKDIAISLTIINISGQILWMIYGIEIDSVSIVVMGGITLLTTSSLLFLKLKYG